MPTHSTRLLRRAPLVAGAVALIAAVTACSGSDSGGGSGGGSADTGGTVNVVYGSTPNQFDPCGTLNGSELSMMTAIYAPLIRSDPATGELSPGIATKWETSADGKTLTLTLRTGLTFSDGSPLDATTAAQSVNQCVKLGNQSVPGLNSVTAKDPTTLVFSLDEPSSGLVDLLGSRLGLLASPKARDSEGSAYGSKPVGAGPYKLDAFVPGSSIKLTRWDGYKDAGPPAAKAATINISIITDPSAQEAALTGGQADYGFRLDPTVAAALKGQDSITLKTNVGVSIADLNIDRSQGPLKDVRVRQAISYAIDRKALASAGSDGLTDVGAVQPYPPGHPYHVADQDSAYGYDPAKAKALLAQAGYPNGLTLRGLSLDGSSFTNAGVVISQQLKQVGINVTFQAKALPDATKSFYTDHRYDIFSTGMNSGPDWFTIYRRLLTKTSAGNAGKVPLPGGDAAVDALNKATTPDALSTALKAANTVFQEQLPIIPLFYSPYVAAWDSKLQGGEGAYAVNGEADLTSLAVSSGS
jgi:peptide/nickel transport system substrate-binding protein